MNDNELIFKNCLEEPFSIHGLLWDDDGFCRMPKERALAVNEGIACGSRETAGGRVRFVTDSPKIAIRAKMDHIYRASHFPLTGSTGFDIYINNNYLGTYKPPVDLMGGYESVQSVPIEGEYEVTIHFPLYNSVLSLEIGLLEGASLKKAEDYRVTTPIVYYGSSVTQGGCASRPGNCYQNIITRKLDCDYINLGFSGKAKGEEAMAHYIAGLPMSVFVYDYDHNAPDVEYLKSTHERMFKIIRDKNPLLPIVLISQPRARLNELQRLRRDVILRTYLNARDEGDDNVYFIDGESMFRAWGKDSSTVDGCHPNDIGFLCMAEHIGSVLEGILGRSF